MGQPKQPSCLLQSSGFVPDPAAASAWPLVDHSADSTLRIFLNTKTTMSSFRLHQAIDVLSVPSSCGAVTRVSSEMLPAPCLCQPIRVMSTSAHFVQKAAGSTSCLRSQACKRICCVSCGSIFFLRASHQLFICQPLIWGQLHQQAAD